MIKTKIVETTEKYDKDGNLVEKITREETTEDDETRFPVTPTIEPYNPMPNPIPVWYKNEPYCTITSTNSVENSCNRVEDQ